MRRTRHVVLPVRSWQYIGLLLVSLACVTFGLVARDREGQAGSLTGPELLHRAPHDVDVCPNLDPFEKSPACLDSPAKQNSVSRNNERREADSGSVRIEHGRSSNRLPERRREQRRATERSFSRSFERMDERIRNVRLANRKSRSLEMQTSARRLSRTSNDRARSMERREEREAERRVLETRELRERRERDEIGARRTLAARTNAEEREIRGNERFRDTVRSIRVKRDSDRERSRDRRSNSIERREWRLEDRERSRDRRSNSVERRNSRIDISNRERRLSDIRDRSQARRTAEIRKNDGQRQRESIRLTDRVEIYDRRSRSMDRLDSNRERRLGLERRTSTERRISENLNRREDQRFNRRTVDLEGHQILDRRSRSLDRRIGNELDRNRRLGLERRVSTERRASENLNRRDIRRELVNRLSRSRFSIDRDSYGEIDRTRFDRSTAPSRVSKNRQEIRKIFLSRGSLERRTSDRTDRREIDTLRRTARSIETRDLPRIARYSSDPVLDRTRNERSDRRVQKLWRETNDDHRLRKSRAIREFNPSRQEKRLSRSSETLNRLNSMERRESFENRRTRTDNESRSSVLSTERREMQQRGPIARTTLRTNDLRERRSTNSRTWQPFVTKTERKMDQRRRSSDSNLIGKVERLIESRSRDQRRNVRSNLTAERNVERRNSDSRIRLDSEKGLIMIERSRENADRRSSYRRLVDLRQSNSLRDKIRASEISTRIQNTLIVPSVDRDRSHSTRDRSLERNRRFLDLDRRVRKIAQDSRDNEYGRRIGVISSFLKSNTVSNYDLTFEVVRQAFVIAICIMYGFSMSKSKKLFTGNLMNRINRFALR